MASATAMVAEQGLKPDPLLLLAMAAEYVNNKDVMEDNPRENEALGGPGGEGGWRGNPGEIEVAGESPSVNMPQSMLYYIQQMFSATKIRLMTNVLKTG